jgi:cobalt/nickel transport system permease protein
VIRIRLAAFVAVGLLVALALAFFVSPQASDEPDGLDKVAMDQGFSEQQTSHRTEDSPLAGYGVAGVESERVSTGLAGVIGVGATFAVAGGALLLVRRTRRRTPPGPRAVEG